MPLLTDIMAIHLSYLSQMICIPALFSFVVHGHESKRLLVDDPSLNADKIRHLESVIANLTNTVSQLVTRSHQQDRIVQELQMSHNSGATYTVWGKQVCPSVAGTTMIYSGYAAGGYYSDRGSGAEYICLPLDPILGNTTVKPNGYGRVYGSEFWGGGFFGPDGEDVPCAVCQNVYSISVLMIPGRNQCYQGWTEEYHGYLASGAYGYASSSSYACVDVHPTFLNGGGIHENGKLFYPVLAKCHPLQCPPYKNDSPLTCVVCSK